MNETTQRIIEQAAAHGSMTALADACRIQRTTLSRAASGSRGLSPRSCIRLHAVVGGELSALVGEVGNDLARAVLLGWSAGDLRRALEDAEPLRVEHVVEVQDGRIVAREEKQ